MRWLPDDVPTSNQQEPPELKTLVHYMHVNTHTATHALKYVHTHSCMMGLGINPRVLEMMTMSCFGLHASGSLL